MAASESQDIVEWCGTLPKKFHRHYASRFDAHNMILSGNGGKVKAPTMSDAWRGLKQTGTALAAGAAAMTGNIPELMMIMYTEIKNFLIQEFCRWRGIPTSVNAIMKILLNYLAKMIEGTDMYKKHGDKIPIAKWCRNFGDWLCGDDLALLEESME
mmetsp:Transcript_16775/g.30899  ORF Transcript_16775/g.30899 Transcript_16775/m.30899 type:complete len:156 (-) Transcript_16775:331-798(-)|eukprot:CAMPEP_0171815908 /NCGR_PEP_ID=MMETSP0992-20121227/181_1 /TAXON_ID=483369 /ORGANISM="non described non described, Strain CCMP2098" /LENGTH=155 /DNA_ID=CAMNT_0012429657 /DNA_START=25 /DNA_END=492 /DNA_ORIENTATION=-